MSVADKLLQVNQVKQDIKVAIETKGIPMTNVAFTEYANKILDIIGGGGVEDEYFYYSKAYYTITSNSTLFANAWQDMKDSETVLFDIPLMLAASNQELEGFNVDLYVGTNGQLQALYDACVNETIPQPIAYESRDVYYINNIATPYMGDIGFVFEIPIPIYAFGLFSSPEDNKAFAIADLTPLGMGLGITLLKIANDSIPNNNIVIQQGFKFENQNGIIIPNSVTEIGYMAFRDWSSNNLPLIIPNSVTTIGEYAFDGWEANNKSLIIPNSVTHIGVYAFAGWSSAKEFIMESETPPTIIHFSFYNTNNAPFYVPDASVEAYKTATNWVELADRIFPMSDR